MRDEHEATFIGVVRHVLGSQVTVALDPNLAGVAPIYRSRIQAIGQIGSLVRIPQGLIDLVATVTLVGIAELAGALSPSDNVQVGERWLQVQLLGEIDRGTRRFQRGVGTYPGLDDRVHFATAEDLQAAFPPPDERYLGVGRLASAEEVPVALDLQKLVMRHSAVVGSTGAGKTSAVSSLLQGIARGGWNAANVVVIDPHGEYHRALNDCASVRSVLGDGDNRLRVPHWALPAEQILRAFGGGSAGATTKNRFSALVADSRRAFVETAAWLNLDPAAVTADTPVPFDLHDVWHTMDAENHETRSQKPDESTACVVEKGSPHELKRTKYKPHGPGSEPPHKAPTYGNHGSVPDQLRISLSDPKLRFLLELPGTAAGPDPLTDAITEWVGGLKPVSVLDFSGVPELAAELAIGVVMHLLFEVASRSEQGADGLGRPHPVLVVLEEAHRYLGEDGGWAMSAANRISREGRKYGVGLMLVTQRPSELPDTALAQCGTLISMRLTNNSDQGKIKNALPDNVGGLAAALPALRTGEAVISGEAVTLPSRTLVDLPDPMPLAEDPSLASWRREPLLPNVSLSLAAWRGTYE